MKLIINSWAKEECAIFGILTVKDKQYSFDNLIVPIKGLDLGSHHELESMVPENWFLEGTFQGTVNPVGQPSGVEQRVYKVSVVKDGIVIDTTNFRRVEPKDQFDALAGAAIQAKPTKKGGAAKATPTITSIDASPDIDKPAPGPYDPKVGETQLMKRAIAEGFLTTDPANEANFKYRSYNIRWSGKGVRMSQDAFDNKHVWIGLTRLPVVTDVQANLDSTASVSQVPRQGGTTMTGLWAYDETIVLNVEFPDQRIDQETGQVDSTYDQIRDLRLFMAQIRVMPFLPISWGEHVTQTLIDVDAVAVEQVMISTKDGTPNSYGVQMALRPFNWKAYLKDKNKTLFADYFVWPIFERYIISILDKVVPEIDYIEDIEFSVANERGLSSVHKFANLMISNNPHMYVRDLRGSEVKSAAQDYLDDLDLIDSLDGMDIPTYTDRSAVRDKSKPWQFNQYLTNVIGPAIPISDPQQRLVYVSIPVKSKIILMNRQIQQAFGIQRFHLDDIDRLGYAELRIERVGGTDNFRNNKAYTILKEVAQMLRKRDAKVLAEIDTLRDDDSVFSDRYWREVIPVRGAVIESIQIIITNQISKAKSPIYSQPTLQFWGSPDTEVSITLSSGLGMAGLKEVFRRCIIQRNRYRPTVTDSRGIEPGFVEIKCRLLSKLGMQFFIPKSLVISTVKKTPGREQGRLDLALHTPIQKDEFDIAQKLTNEYVQDQSHPGYTATRIGIDVEIENKIALIPLYPDLFLPTYQELTTWAQGAGLMFRLPDEVSILNQVDPDFYINSADPTDKVNGLDLKKIIENINPSLTISSRLISDKPTVISASDTSYTMVKPRDPEDVKHIIQEEERIRILIDPDSQKRMVPDAAGEDIETEWWRDPVIPWSNAACARGSFQDMKRSQINRLVLAFPTFLGIFYREGQQLGYKRLWDQFFGRIALFDLDVYSSTDSPVSTAMFSVAAPNQGMTTADLESMRSAEESILSGTNFLARDDGLPTLESLGDASFISVDTFKGEKPIDHYARVWKFDDTFWRRNLGEGPFDPNTFDWELNINPALETRWRDSANVLVLSPGTRVHLRLGFGSAVNNLPTVFNGTLTEVQLDENKLRCLAASDGVELDIDLNQRGAINNTNPGNSKRASWTTYSMRGFILSVLGAFEPISAQKWKIAVRRDARAAMVSGAVFFDENKYGINHFGLPYTRSVTGDGTTQGLLRRDLNRTEIGQNLYSGALAEYDRIPEIMSEGIYNATVEALEDSNKLYGSQIDVAVTVDETGAIIDQSMIPGQLSPEEMAARKDRLKTWWDSAVGLWQRFAYAETELDLTTEQLYQINTAGKSFWQLCFDLAFATPGYVTAVRPFGVFRSTLFWGKPIWPVAFRYVNKGEARGRMATTRSIEQADYETSDNYGIIAGAIDDMTMVNDQMAGIDELKKYFELEIKTFAQTHLAHSALNLIHMGIVATGEHVKTNARVFGLNRKGDWIGSEIITMVPGENVVTVQVDNDIYPESQATIDVALPYKRKFTRVMEGATRASGYGQARLADTCQRMYEGHLIIHGNGWINPWDNIQVTDHMTKTRGLCFARAVHHKASMVGGFTTDILPGALAWPKVAVSNMETMASIAARASIVSAAVDLVFLEQQAGLYMIQYGAAQIAKAISLVKDSTTGMQSFDPEIKTLTKTIKKLRASTSFERIQHAYVEAIDTIISVLARIYKNEGTFIRRSGQPIAAKHIVAELSDIKDRLKGHQSATIASIGSLNPSGDPTFTAALIDEIQKDVTYSNRANLYARRRPKRAVEIGVSAESVVVEGAPTGLLAKMAGIPFLCWVPKLAAKPDLYVDYEVDGVQIMLLTRAGRELSAGITGHKGCVIGEPGSGMDEWKKGLRGRLGYGDKLR